MGRCVDHSSHGIGVKHAKILDHLIMSHPCILSYHGIVSTPAWLKNPFLSPRPTGRLLLGPQWFHFLGTLAIITGPMISFLALV